MGQEGQRCADAVDNLQEYWLSFILPDPNRREAASQHRLRDDHTGRHSLSFMERKSLHCPSMRPEE
jgi:hypothetical protein